jgi:hypothetical protein
MSIIGGLTSLKIIVFLFFFYLIFAGFYNIYIYIVVSHGKAGIIRVFLGRRIKEIYLIMFYFFPLFLIILVRFIFLCFKSLIILICGIKDL